MTDDRHILRDPQPARRAGAIGTKSQQVVGRGYGADIETGEQVFRRRLPRLARISNRCDTGIFRLKPQCPQGGNKARTA